MSLKVGNEDSSFRPIKQGHFFEIFGPYSWDTKQMWGYFLIYRDAQDTKSRTFPRSRISKVPISSIRSRTGNVESRRIQVAWMFLHYGRKRSSDRAPRADIRLDSFLHPRRTRSDHWRRYNRRSVREGKMVRKMAKQFVDRTSASRPGSSTMTW